MDVVEAPNYLAHGTEVDSRIYLCGYPSHFLLLGVVVRLPGLPGQLALLLRDGQVQGEESQSQETDDGGTHGGVDNVWFLQGVTVSQLRNN